ncbi:MAG: septum formation family protein [Acidimicrobiales bacterium]
MGLGRVIGGAAAGLGLVGLGYTGLAGQDDTTRDDSGAIVEEGELGAFRIRLGDCLVGLDGDAVESTRGVPCDQPHEFEVYFAFNLPDGDFPGDTAAGDHGNQRCYDVFSAFVGVSYEESIYGYTSLVPSQESWEQVDDREVLCLVGNYDGTRKTGSAEGTAI